MNCGEKLHRLVNQMLIVAIVSRGNIDLKKFFELIESVAA